MNTRKSCLSMLSLLSVMVLLASPTPGNTTHASTPLAAPSLQPNRVVIGTSREPTNLYIYGGDPWLAPVHVWSAIYDGPIDIVSFAYQPVILERLPSLTNGDLQIRRVNVGVGSRVLAGSDDNGNGVLDATDSYDTPMDLTAGITDPVWLRPAGCYSNACAVPWLPSSGTLQMEQMVATFRIVEGVTWADGTPVTAADSVYSFELCMDPATPGCGLHYTGERTASYAAEGERTVVWTGLPGYRASTYLTNFWTPLPEHLWGSLSAGELLTATISSRTPIGYGPYTVQAWTPGEAITLTANSYYFRAGEGLPRIPTLVFRFYETAQDALDALVAGQVDVLTQDNGLNSVMPQLLDLEGQGLLRVNLKTSTAFEHADFGINPVESYVRPDFFEDARMRQAIGMCLDRQAVIDEFLYGASVVPATYIRPDHPLYPAGLTPWPYNPISATLMLEQMGWTDQDHDGVRECHSCNVAGATEGTPLAFRWTSTTAPIRVAYMQRFRDNLATCGISVTLENIPASEFFADGPEGPLFGRHFDVGSFTWLTAIKPPCSLYMSDQIPGEENGWAGVNNIGYTNPSFDAACSMALQSLPGTPTYVAAHQAALRIVGEELPTLPLYLQVLINASQPRLVGLSIPTSGSELYSVEEWTFLVDGSPPTGTLRAGDGSQTANDVSLTLHLTANDAGGGSVQWMLVREQTWDGLNWNTVNQSGWVSNTTPYSWTLAATPGAHYLSAYWMDDSGNISPLPGQTIVNYTPVSADIAGGAIHVYRLRMQAGESFTATLTTQSGDADLYVWRPGNDGPPDAYSQEEGTALDQVVISHAEEGDYHIEVHGYAASSAYHLDLAAPPLTSRRARLTPDALTTKAVPDAPLTTAVPDDTPLAAPGGLPAIVVLRSPLERLANGGHQAPLSVLVYDSHHRPAADGTAVTFTTTLGHFAESGAATATQELSGGIARVTLVSGDEGGQAQVTAMAGEVQDTLNIPIHHAIYLPLVSRRNP